MMSRSGSSSIAQRFPTHNIPILEVYVVCTKCPVNLAAIQNLDVSIRDRFNRIDRYCKSASPAFASATAYSIVTAIEYIHARLILRQHVLCGHIYDITEHVFRHHSDAVFLMAQFIRVQWSTFPHAVSSDTFVVKYLPYTKKHNDRMLCD